MFLSRIAPRKIEPAARVANGRVEASQRYDEGSIPLARSAHRDSLAGDTSAAAHAGTGKSRGKT